MSYRSFVSIVMSSVVIAILSIVALGAPQQTDTWAHPITPWGDPDIQGLWPADKLNGVPLQRPQDFGDRDTLDDEEFAERLVYAERQLEIDTAEFASRRPLIGRGGRFLECDDDPSRCRDGVRIGLPNYWDERGVPNRMASLVVDPANGRIPLLTPQAQQAADERNAARRARTCTGTTIGCADSYEDFSLWNRCISRGITSLWPGGYNKGNQIVQSPGVVAIRNEMIHETRLVWLDGREPPPPDVVTYMGYSMGHWDGNTLVVETTNLNGVATIGGARHSDNFVMVERFARIDEDTLNYEATMTDPSTWTSPWTVAFPLELDPSYDIYEYACHEANYFLYDALTGARTLEARETDAQ
jgi:hypothetical protein